MSAKHLFVPLLVFVVSAGCSLERQSSPNVTAVPSYWQSQTQLEQNQLAEMRAFHEKEADKISEDVHVFRNHEMERLAAAGKELEREKPRQEVPQKMPEQRKQWASWFKKKDKNNTPLVSETNQNVR